MDTEMDEFAVWMVTKVVEWTRPGSDERHDQFELIVDHLARTTMRVGLNKADTFLSVDFPDRPRIQ